MSGLPRVRVARRVEPSVTWNRWSPVFALAFAAILAAILLLATGHSPIEIYSEMFRTAFLSNGALSATLVSSTPLVFTGLAAAVAFRSRIWNIGGEGQLFAGAVCAAGAGIALGGSGVAVSVIAMIIAGMVGGALWAAIPGALRTWFRTNEILTSLMLNYVAGLVMAYLIFDSYSYWRDLSSPLAAQFPQGRSLEESAFWPSLQLSDLVVPLGFVIGAALAVILIVAMRTTRFWFRLDVASSSTGAGRYAGIRMSRMMMAVFAISGALAGLGGASQVGDFSHVLEPSALQVAAFGYTGIVVAALARYNPIGVVFAAVCLGALTNAGFKLQGPDFPPGMVGVMQGILLFCVLSAEFLARRSIRITRGDRAAEARTPEGDEQPQVGAPMIDLTERSTTP